MSDPIPRSGLGRFFHSRIFVKYITLTLLVGGALNLIILMLYWDRQRNAQSSAVATEISTLSNAVAGPVSLLLERGDKNEARKLLAVFSGYPHIICADFYLTSSQAPALSWPVIGCERIKKPGSTAEVPLAMAKSGAKMVLRLDDAQLRRALNEDMGVILAFGLLGGFVLIVAGALSFAWLIVKPLKKLVSAIDIFERDNTPTKVASTSEDEVGRVIDSYNQLLDREVERVGALRKAHRQTMESVNYATRIQSAILPRDTDCDDAFSAFAKIWRPRDLVSGDMYWLRRSGDITTLAVIDCTGHGVPGGFMTMIAAATLDRVYQDGLDISPSDALTRLSDLTKSVLGQGKDGADSNDGMDAAILRFDAHKPYVLFSGAQLSLFVETPVGFRRIKGDRVSLGYKDTRSNPRFGEHKIDLSTQPMIALATDGLIDQVGGPRGLAFGYKRLVSVMDAHSAGGVHEVCDAVSKAHTNYAQGQEQRDDVTFIVFKG